MRSSLRERVHGAHCSAACALQIVYAAEKSCLWFRSLRTRIARLRLQPGPPRSSAQAAACARAQAHPLTRVPRANVPRAKANDEKPGTTAREFRKILHMLTEIYLLQRIFVRCSACATVACPFAGNERSTHAGVAVAVSSAHRSLSDAVSAASPVHRPVPASDARLGIPIMILTLISTLTLITPITTE